MSRTIAHYATAGLAQRREIGHDRKLRLFGVPRRASASEEVGYADGSPAAIGITQGDPIRLKLHYLK